MEYGLIGEHLGHSYSREIHEIIADYSYELCELKPDKLEAFLKKQDFCAVNVTIPYKQAVIPYLDEISDTAKRIGAVNTIVKRGGRLWGYNTDLLGMRALAFHMGIELRGKKVLILGTGGTSKTAHAVAESLGAKNIIHVSRSRGVNAVTYDEAVLYHTDARIIINTTPVGMYPNVGNTSIDISAFPDLEGILDVIYNPLCTNLVLDGIKRAIPSFGGLYMLSAQAVYASALFLGKEIDTTLINNAYRKVKQVKQNIVLIGMPTSGKTTVGYRLAQRTGKIFIDTDKMIVSKIGIPISDFFARYGEAAFRKLERKVIAEAAVKSGCIVATGGGAVLDPVNVRALRRNGVIVFLDRPLEQLASSADRPLSADKEALARLYHQRYELYKNTADVHIDCSGNVAATGKAIWKEVQK